MVAVDTTDERRLDYAFQVLANLVMHASPDQIAHMRETAPAVCAAARNALWRTVRVLNSVSPCTSTHRKREGGGRGRG